MPISAGGNTEWGIRSPGSRLVLRMEMNQSLEDLAPSHQRTGSIRVLPLGLDSASHIHGSNPVRSWNHCQHQGDCA